MHISEGVLSAPVLLAGAALTAGCVSLGLKKMDNKRIPEVAVLSSALFVASLIRIPFGPSSVHLVFNGLAGILLGWMAFPSILVALTLQALVFQYGGFTVLGVNTFNMGAPAILTYYLFKSLIRAKSKFISALAGFLAGSVGVTGGSLLIALSLINTGEEFFNIAGIQLIAHVPVMIIEGIITSFCILFLKKVRPEILEVAREKTL